jgi:ribonuclease HII
VWGFVVVGVGCLAGPVVVCAVYFGPNFYLTKSRAKLGGLKESKLLSPELRRNFSRRLLKGKDIQYAVTYSSATKVDELNIYQASRAAMREAVKKIIAELPKPAKYVQKIAGESGEKTTRSEAQKMIVLVDGNKKIKDLDFDQQAIVKGDQKIFAIACASIIAKVHRDALMKRYAKQYPAYGFEQHKGYSTKQHQEMLRKHGPCAIHRRSFRLEY